MADQDGTIKKLESFVIAARSSPEIDRVADLAEQIERRQMGLDPESIVLRASSMRLRVEQPPEELKLPARHSLKRQNSL